MRPHAFIISVSLYSYNFGPEMGPLSAQLLWLVLGGVPFPLDSLLQPPWHGIHQVLQENIHEISILVVCTVIVTASSIETAAS
jgi:hypothetical protein